MNNIENITKEIEILKKEKNAVILAHYYTEGAVQAVADYVGDSYYLAKVAKSTDCDVVVFCGVLFMGESAKILNPDKTVLMPDMTADCAMAHMASVEKIEQLKNKYDDLAVVCYINSTAELKCHSDVCVTSSNAVNIVKNLENKNIFFIPDKNLGGFVAKQVPDKNIILNDGCCPIHAAIKKCKVEALKSKHPEAIVLTHPECEQEILDISDFIGSTADILTFAKNSDCNEFIICTEDGVSYPLEMQNPEKRFYYVTKECNCLDMKKITLQKILHVLKTGENEVFVDEKTCKDASKSLDAMLEMAAAAVKC